MSKDSLLIELGTEELPPKTLKKLNSAFSRELLTGLLEAELISQQQSSAARSFATPRRLALLVPELISAQPDQSVERRGPAVKAAFDDQGAPTPAAQGFAKSCGVDVSDLERINTDKGEWLSYTLQQKGQTVDELIPGIIDHAIKRLPIAKRMRWGSGNAEFVRPVKWLIVMHGNRVIPATVLDVAASNTTRGHRFHSQGEIIITSADDYESVLLSEGGVVADFEARQAMISEQITRIADEVSATIESDADLLDEVTGLVEYPTALLGEFDQDFLTVPQECLVSSMRDHQKYFHLLNAKGKLLPYFITVSNIQSSNPERVKNGNERVLRARLADARFFWETDRKQKLESRIDQLKSVLFHQKLGSVFNKSKRIEKLSGLIAVQINANQSLSERAALLAKADLVSDMVGEFDELQGIMGHYYADLDGEDKLIGDCIEQHYWPKFAGDQLPVSGEAQAVALADKLDSLVGIYAAGEIPTGDKDPYGLRRASLSILRILIEQELDLELPELVAMSAKVYAQTQEYAIDSATQTQIVDFVRGRLTAYYQGQAIDTNTINSVMACEPASPLDFEQRLKAVNEFANAAEAVDLAAANKRIANILKKQNVKLGSPVNTQLLVEPAEQELYKAIATIEGDCKNLFANGDYALGLQKLATLRTPVDNFFEHVMVMCDDQDQQQNRLALLSSMQQLFLQVADISLLQG